MIDEELRPAVDRAYRAKYPQVTHVNVRDIVREMLPGALVVVGCVAGDGNHGPFEEWEEMCYVRDGTVRIFDTTEALVREMLNESRNVESLQRLEERRAAIQDLRHRFRRHRFWLLLATASLALAALVAVAQSATTTLPIVTGLCALAAGVVAFALRYRVRDFDADLQELESKIDLQRYAGDPAETRAEKILRINDVQLRRYYDSSLRQNAVVFWFGVICILLGVGVTGYALWLITRDSAGANGVQLQEKIVTAVLGAVGALLTNFVAAIYLKMHAEAAKNMVTLHARLADTHRSLFGNLVASRIKDERIRWETLSKIAVNVSLSTPSPR